MSVTVLGLGNPPNSTGRKMSRPTSTFHPCLWTHHFLTNSSHFNKEIDVATQKEHGELKQEVREKLVDANCDHSKRLRLIDAVQLLGVGYHFEQEIDDALEMIYRDGDTGGFDLYTVALWFRLLRQQGINAPSDVFKMFMDEKGKFKVDLVDDIPGMLNLYEAAYHSLRGEYILDEALAFTTSNLESIAAQKQISPQLAEQISHALNRPIRKSFPRIEARHHISLYSRDDHFASSNGALLKFAKIDFNMLQVLHLKELRSVIEWWKKLDFTTKLPYARDRVVECYFWANGCYFEPKYSLARIFLTKAIVITSVLDDTFDNYGTYEELKVFTKCIQRWDVHIIDQLPEYMKLVYWALLDIYGEIEEEFAKEGRSYVEHSAIESIKELVQSYLVETKWREEGYVPRFEEYMEMALITSCARVLVANSFVAMGKVASKEVFTWLSNDPKILVAFQIIGRLMDDIVTHQSERQRDHVASAVECYMKQNDVSREDAVKFFHQEITNAWKMINEELMKPTVIPMPILTRVLNFARAIDVVYKDGDGYSKSYLLKDHIASLFVDPVPL